MKKSSKYDMYIKYKALTISLHSLQILEYIDAAEALHSINSMYIFTEDYF